jgi:hypothetical protein
MSRETFSKAVLINKTDFNLFLYERTDEPTGRSLGNPVWL